MSENTTRPVYLIKLIEVVEDLGYPTQGILRSAGLARVDLEDRDGSLSIVDYAAAVRSATQLCPVPDLVSGSVRVLN